MSEEGDTVGSDGAQLRSLANRLAGITAGQEQLQKDVDKLRASTNATLIVVCYVLAVSVIVFVSVRYPGKVTE